MPESSFTVWTVDNVIVGVYLLVILGLGLWSGRGTKNLKTFAVAQRSYSWFVIFATLSASFIGGGFSIGNAEKVATLAEDVIASAKGWYALGAMDPGERTQALDLLGFDAQLVFSTFSVEQFAFAAPDVQHALTGPQL